MYSLTYLAVLLLTGLGVENADTFVNAAVIVISGLVALYGRYRTGDLHWSGLRK